jgi:hypothetical protein
MNKDVLIILNTLANLSHLCIGTKGNSIPVNANTHISAM